MNAYKSIAFKEQLKTPSETRESNRERDRKYTRRIRVQNQTWNAGDTETEKLQFSLFADARERDRSYYTQHSLSASIKYE